MKKYDCQGSLCPLRLLIKYVLLMKLAIFLILTTSFQSIAFNASSQQLISLNVKNLSLPEIIKQIETHYNYRFVYNEEVRQSGQKVTLDVKNATVDFVMQHLLKETRFSYKKINSTLVVIIDSTTEKAILPISGKVVDENGIALPGVSIVEKGTGNGVSTNQDGAFTINVNDENAILVISTVEYVTREMSVKSDNYSRIVLARASARLDEVVVVGYGRQKRKDVTGSVASVPKERMEIVPNLNVAQALQGSVPGMMIQQGQGGAAPQQSIMIRGRNSILASNEPLIVMDGVPYSGNIMDINPNDVVSIEVLKDASSAAIYGSRGANGVILITTKIGSTGKPRITLDSKISTQEAIHVPQFLSGEEFYTFKEEREPGKITATEQEVYDKKQWVNWADLALRKGFSQEHNLSVAGGYQNTNYFIGGSFLNVKGVAINDGYRRVTARINLETEITKWLKIGTRNQFSNDNREGYPLDWETVLRTNPLTKAYNANGSLSLYPWEEYHDIHNPLEPLNYDYTNQSNQIVSNNFAIVKLPFIQGLTYQLNTGIRRKFTNGSSYMGRNTAAGLEEGGIGSTTRGEEKNNVIENILSYTRNFGVHNIFATAAYMYEENEGVANSLEGRKFPNDFITYYSMSQAGLLLPDYTYVRTVLNSQMLRVNYSYNSRYLLTLTGRRDGYSGFGVKEKWGLFPSVALGWNLSEENFFPWRDAVNKLKLRVSYGINGNQAVGAYETISRYKQSNIVAVGNSLSGYVPSKIGMDDLGWESSKTFNIGLDYGLANNRIDGDINIFNTNTYDLLLNRTISLVNGLTSITQNIGKTKNTGVEFSVNSRNIVSNDFKWSTGFNMAYIKNQIISLYGMKDKDGKEVDDLANSWFIGKPIRSNYSFVFDGVWQESEAAEAAVWNSKPGFAKIKDSNGDGKIDASDREIIGHQDPAFTWGLSNTFSYRGVTLNIFMHGIHGVTMQNQQLQDASASSEVRRSVLKKNWWTPDNPTNEYYKNELNAEKMGGISVAIFEKASFVRIKDISLSYDIQERLINSVGINRLRLYLVARNMLTFTKWTGGDPELNNGRGVNPLQREIVAGLTVTF